MKSYNQDERWASAGISLLKCHKLLDDISTMKITAKVDEVPQDWHEPRGRSCSCGCWIPGMMSCPSCQALATEARELNQTP